MSAVGDTFAGESQSQSYDATHMKGEQRWTRHTGAFRVGGLFLPSPSSPPQVVMKVDVVYEKEMLHLYVLSGIGGLLLLLLIFLALYKVGGSRWSSTARQLGQRGNTGRDQKEHTGIGSLRAQTGLSSLRPSTGRSVRANEQVRE